MFAGILWSEQRQLFYAFQILVPGSLPADQEVL